MHPHDSPWPTLAALLVAGLAAVYVWRRPDFVIRVRDGQCRCTGSLPLAVHRAVAQFFLDDLRPQGPVTVRGKRRGGRLVLWFRGDLTPGERQRVRNFLLTRR